MPRTVHRTAAVAIVSTLSATAARGQVTFSIDPTQGRTAVSPLIYGVNPNNTYAAANPGLSQSAYAGLNLTSERLGGDRWTAYNYLNNASNAGSDYYYSNDNYLGGGGTPAGAVLPFVQSAAANNASPIVTVPINGYVSADESGSVGSAPFPATPSSHFVPEFPTRSADPSPAAGHVYQDGFVKLVAAAYPGTAARPLAFMLDNEPDLWSSSHPEVHPAATTYAELLSKSIAYATMIKQTAPTALVYGPASYGWDGYQTLQDAPDSAANGNFINYYLHGMATASAAANTRLLDALDLHWYPEARNTDGSDRITDDSTAPDVVAARLQAPRSLWDPTYSENSYIAQYNGPIQLIPLMQRKIAANYPGTKLSFSEYNYGAGDAISGGLAEADVLGIFGKYGVYSADEWPLLDSEPYVAGAFRLFRNYDGKNSAFGDTEVSAMNSDTVNASVYAATDSTVANRLTIVALNKQATTTAAALNVANGGSYDVAVVYQLTGSNPVPQYAGTLSLANPAALAYSMPGYSASTIGFAPDQWATTSGSWGTVANWSVAPPDAAGTHANFFAAAAATAVTLDGNRTVGRLTFNSGAGYTIAPGTGGTLTLDDGVVGDATIAVLLGSHTISAPVNLVAASTITTAAGTALTISGNVTGTGGLTVAGGGAVTLSGSDNYGPTTVATGATLAVAGSLSATAILTSAGTTTFAANPATTPLVRTVGGLAVPAGGSVIVSSSAARTLLAVGSLSLAGTLDLTTNDLDVAAGDVAAITAAVRAGTLLGSAAAIDPTRLTTLGVLANRTAGGTPIYTQFDGRAVAAADVLVGYTYYGDADLNGTVDGADYARIDAGYAGHLTGWANGDFNLDGTVDGSDYTLIDNAFNGQSGRLGASPSIVAVETDEVAAVPEPAALVASAAVGLVARRRFGRVSTASPRGR